MPSKVFIYNANATSEASQKDLKNLFECYGIYKQVDVCYSDFE